jgi:hypothetical protein
MGKRVEEQVLSEKVQMLGQPNPEDQIVDDELKDKHPPFFDWALVDRRKLGDRLVNQSEAVIQLDVRPTEANEEADFLVLQPSYASLVATLRANHPDVTLLPFINLIDGKAKQFDDGLYAALDLA